MVKFNDKNVRYRAPERRCWDQQRTNRTFGRSHGSRRIENLDSDDVEGASKIIRKTTAMVEDCSIQFQKALEIEKNVEVASEMLVRLQYLHKIEEETRRKCDHLIAPSL